MDAQGEASLGLADLLLETLSPQEAALLDAFGPALLDHADQRPASDGALGFGVEEMAWWSATVPIASVVVSYMGEVAKDAATDAVKDRLGSWLRALRGRRREVGRQGEPPLEPLPSDLATKAGQLAYEHALALGLEDARARLLGS